MDYNQFKSLLNLKDIRSKESVPMLKELTEKFPYFQTARVLLAKSLHDQQSIHYDEALKIAAAYAPDRKVLQDLIDNKVSRPTKERIASSSIPPREEFSNTQPPIQELEFKKIISPAMEEKEYYSEDEISGKAFEEQEQKEKIVDPHKVIQQRLSEILKAPDQTKEEIPLSKPIVEKKEVPQPKVEEKQPDVVSIKTPEITAEQVPLVIYEEPSTSQDFGKTEPVPNETSSTVENRNEEIIIEEAGKAHDILDRMEIEHALEESILASLEKLPIIAEEKTTPLIPSLKSEQVKPVREIIKPKEESAKPDLSKPKSFTEWMSAISPKPFNRFEEVHQNQKASTTHYKEETPDRDLDDDFEEEEIHHSHDEDVSHEELIDKFIATEPKIVASKAEFYSPISQAKKSLIEHEDLATETLARIYTGQGHFAKARWCYEKLILLYPEKSSYFAALLKEIDLKEKEIK